MAESEGTARLRDMVREVIDDAYADGASDNLRVVEGYVEAMMKIIESVHANALAYGRALGEQAVLDSVLTVDMSETSLRTWKQAIDERIEAGR